MTEEKTEELGKIDISMLLAAIEATRRNVEILSKIYFMAMEKGITLDGQDLKIQQEHLMGLTKKLIGQFDDKQKYCSPEERREATMLFEKGLISAKTCLEKLGFDFGQEIALKRKALQHPVFSNEEVEEVPYEEKS